MKKTGLREMKKRANREAILNAGRQVFAEIGYDAATTRDIVRISGLSPGTFYNYFSDKDVVFRELIQVVIDELQARVRHARMNATSASGFLNDAFRSYLDMFKQDPPLLQLVARNQAVLRMLIFNEGLAAGLFEDLETDLKGAMSVGLMPEVPVNLLTWTMVGAGFEILAQMTKHPELDIDMVADFLSNLFLGGIERLGRKATKDSEPTSTKVE